MCRNLNLEPNQPVTASIDARNRFSKWFEAISRFSPVITYITGSGVLPKPKEDVLQAPESFVLPISMEEGITHRRRQYGIDDLPVPIYEYVPLKSSEPLRVEI